MKSATIIEKVGAEVASLINENVKDINLINNTLYFIQTENTTYTYDWESKILEESLLDLKDDNSTVICKLTNDEKAKIAEENMALIHYVLKGIVNSGIDYDELESVGYLGLAKALDSFDKMKGFRFATYAINCITNEVLFFLRKEKKHIVYDVSLQKELMCDKKGNSLTLEDTLEDTNFEKKGIDGNILDEERKTMLLDAICKLNDEEQYIMLYRFGLDGRKKKTQKIIAQDLNMSQANISKIQKSCLRDLKLILQKDM